MTTRRRLSIGAMGLCLAAAVGCATTTTGARPSPFPHAPMPADYFPAPAPAADAPAATRTGDILDTALALRGTPYLFGGDAPDTGFDCSGFVRYVFELHQIDLPRTVDEQYHAGREIRSGQIEAGDLIFFTTTAPGATHVGIALDRDSFVHAPGSGGVVRIDRIDTPYWRERMLSVRRVL
jgi:cell wall-associated NlpC family hydrolase